MKVRQVVGFIIFFLFCLSFCYSQERMPTRKFDIGYSNLQTRDAILNHIKSKINISVHKIQQQLQTYTILCSTGNIYGIRGEVRFPKKFLAKLKKLISFLKNNSTHIIYIYILKHMCSNNIPGCSYCKPEELEYVFIRE